MKRLPATVIFVWFCLSGPAFSATTKLPLADPETVGMSSSMLSRIDLIVEDALTAKRMPGCVIVVGRQGKVAFRKAYGNRQVQPEPLPMTEDTVFDMASITKPVATASSIMLLIERGLVRLRDRVSEHLPEFAANGKRDITIEQLLIHQSGLISDNPLDDYGPDPQESMQRILAIDKHAEPGTSFIYSDVGYIVLGEIIRRVTGQNVHEFARQNIFLPLGMTETGFVPDSNLRARSAPTERREGDWIQGQVHDPRAYHLGGIAGHAGLFSTADDLSVYAQMMLERGTYQDVRVFSPLTVQKMTRRYPVSSGFRGLGWDMQSPYSSNKPDLFSDSAFGHGGFTGTVLWIDPELDLFFIFLSNRVHPDGKGNVNPLAARIGSIAASAIVNPADRR
jgi:CubicO group peptidase (beta-lactamase class C family)